MADLIERSAAIDAIQRAYADTEGGDDKCAVWKNVGLTSALHIMQDLPSAQPERKTGWIPCSERLPEYDIDVLVQMSDDSMMVDYRTASSSGWCWAEKDDLPVAWMPLPEPWKGET